MKILILGSSGSGKTYLSNKFIELGEKAVDADEIDGLHGWYDWQKRRAKFPKDASKEFLDNHEFLWDRNLLQEYLRKNPDIYFFGMSGNVFKMLDLFDKVYYLSVPDSVILERLDYSTRANPMGKTDFQKKAVLDWEKELRKRVEKFNIPKIDGTLSAGEILHQLNSEN